MMRTFSVTNLVYHTPLILHSSTFSDDRSQEEPAGLCIFVNEIEARPTKIPYNHNRKQASHNTTWTMNGTWSAPNAFYWKLACDNQPILMIRHWSKLVSLFIYCVCLNGELQPRGFPLLSFRFKNESLGLACQSQRVSVQLHSKRVASSSSEND